MKTVAVMQPYLFPYIGYFQALNAVDQYVIFDDVQYIVRGWINRNNILLNGDKHLFTISLQGASANKLINEIEILDDLSKLQKTLALAYAKAPYKEPVLQLVERICNYGDRNLALFIGNSLGEIAAYLDIQTKLLYSSGIDKDNELKAQDKIIDICKRLGADRYINAIGGQGLYSRERFDEENLEMKFLKPHLSEYPQLGNAFVPGLSIIDVMMFNSPDRVKEMLNDYELV